MKLEEAIELTKKALKLFSFEKKKLNRCIHGAAVSLFQIAYLYELLNTRLNEQTCPVTEEKWEKTAIFKANNIEK